MSYCRFENTYNDLKDCEEALSSQEGMDKKYELPKAVRLIMTCQDIAEQFEGMDEKEIEKELKSWKEKD